MWWAAAQQRKKRRRMSQPQPKRKKRCQLRNSQHSPQLSSPQSRSFATIPEDITAENDAEQEAGEQAEEEAAARKVTTENDVNWQEADFSFEDAPPPPSKESLTPALCRKISPPWLTIQTQKCRMRNLLLTSDQAASARADLLPKGERRKELCL